MIEPNQSWAGPYHRMPLARWMLVHPITGIEEPKSDPYPPDVLAACPMAREWGVVLAGPTKSDERFDWRSGDNKWYWNDKEWYENQADDLGRYGNRKECLANPPKKAPPGYVAAKPDFQKALDRVDARAEKVVANIPLSQRAIISQTETKPTLLDELAEVGFEAMFTDLSYNDQTPGRKRDWKAVALSVARRLLEREPSEADVEALETYLGDAVSATTEALVGALKASHRAQLAELEAK